MYALWGIINIYLTVMTLYTSKQFLFFINFRGNFFVNNLVCYCSIIKNKIQVIEMYFEKLLNNYLSDMLKL